MKKYFFLLVTFIIISCNKNNVVSENQYLPNYSFSVDINTNLPSYNNLLFPSNPLLIDNAGVGINGVIVMKVGEGDYRAFEASCPNQPLTPCSKMTLKGVNAVCPCDTKEYSLYTGVALSGGQYPLKSYRIELDGSNIRVYN
jgi:nitrite reductase/ring-hydroxylating ferredoxin subunit